MNAIRYFKYETNLGDVIIDAAFIEDDRKNIICYPSQIGCPISCKFCHSKNFVRHLTLKEMCQIINAGLVHQNKDKPTILSCMAEGEPGLNDDVKAVMWCYFYNYKLGLASVGIKPKLFPGLNEFKDILKVTLSLHATTDKIRQYLIPGINNRIEDIMPLFREYEGAKEINYLLLDGINDRWGDVSRLREIAGDVHVKFCVINKPQPESKIIKSSSFKEFVHAYIHYGGLCEVWQSDGEREGTGCGLLTHRIG